MRSSDQLSAARAAAIAFATAFATLAAQILVHRIVSAKLLNNFAFLVISLTMLGFAVSGVVLARWLPRFLARMHETILACAALFAVSAVAASVLFYRVGTTVYLADTRAEFFGAFARTMPLALLYTLPFAFAGLILGLLLTAPRLPVRTIYCWDLLGSAAGALLVLPAIATVGVEVSLLVVAALALVIPYTLLPARDRWVRALGVVSVAVIAFAATFRASAFEMTYPQGSMLAATRDRASGWAIEYDAWDPVAHIEVVRIPALDARTRRYPALLGSDPAYWARVRRMLTQNNFAFTFAPYYDGTRDSLSGIEQTIFAAPYQVRSVQHPRVFVIGVGGGTDVLTALAFDSTSVVAAEVNGATVAILNGGYDSYFRR